MRTVLIKIWHDPVLSIVIAGGITTLIAAIVVVAYGVTILWICLGLLFATALYILFAKVRPSFESGDDNARIKKFSRKVRLIARIAAIAIPSACIIFGAYRYYSAVPAKPFIIVVADFDSVDGKNYGIRENLVQKLREATQQFPEIEIQTLGETIGAKAGSEHAQDKGKERNAALVLWGWNLNYHVTASFEVLNKPTLLNLRSGSESISGPTMNESFDVQAQVANDMNHLVLLTIGLARFELEDYDGAITLMSRAILHKAPDQIIDPSTAYFYRGAAYYFLYKYPQALSDFDQVVALDPSKIQGYINRALVLRLTGDFTKSEADNKKAIELLNQLIERNGNDNHAYLMRGIVYANTRDYPTAIIDFSKAIGIQPNDLEALSYRAQVYERIEDYDHAVFDWSKIIELDPAYAKAYVRRGLALGRKGELNRSFADFSSAFALKPKRNDLATAFLGRGNVYSMRQENDRALADYNEALKLEPNFAEAFVGRCILYSRRKEAHRAIAECSTAFGLKPTLVEAVINRGDIYCEQRDFARALEDYRQAVRLDPDDASTYSKLAGLYGSFGQYGEAIQAASRAIELKRDDATAFYNRGAAYYHKGLLDLALADFDEAIRLDPNYALAHSSRAKALKAKVSK